MTAPMMDNIGAYEHTESIDRSRLDGPKKASSQRHDRSAERVILNFNRHSALLLDSLDAHTAQVTKRTGETLEADRAAKRVKEDNAARQRLHLSELNASEQPHYTSLSVDLHTHTSSVHHRSSDPTDGRTATEVAANGTQTTINEAAGVMVANIEAWNAKMSPPNADAVGRADVLALDESREAALDMPRVTEVKVPVQVKLVKRSNEIFSLVRHYWSAFKLGETQDTQKRAANREKADRVVRCLGEWRHKLEQLPVRNEWSPKEAKLIVPLLRVIEAVTKHDAALASSAS